MVPHYGQMLVALSLRERAGGAVYCLPQRGHTRPAWLLLFIVSSFRYPLLKSRFLYPGEVKGVDRNDP